MENKDQVSYLVHESSMARQERTIKRLILALIFSIVLMFTTNTLWILAWTSYDYVDNETETITVDGENGSANYIGDDNEGDVNYGKSDSDKNKNPNENP